MKSLLVFRPFNLLIVAILQMVTFYYLDFDHAPINRELIGLVLASICITAAGYVFNDWMDRPADQINKPSKTYISSWSKLLFWMTYIILSALGLALCLLISIQLFYYYLCVALLLIVYTLVLKRLPLIGNFSVSLLAAFSVYVVFLVFGTQDRKLIIFYAGFAALITYVREIVKDMEDIEGDTSVGYRTFPVLAGIRQSRMIVLITSVFSLVSYSNLLLQWVKGQFNMPTQGVVMAYHALCVLLPLIALVYFAYTSEQKSDYSRLSTIAKYIMVTGLLSMMFY
ncbi:MAG: 4-hydroxybenzoate polyprenyltransferase [Bacteroidia bacterium]